ncbi:hypothetical protein HDU93_004988 [Gonapodya sp. JEL0774]|nr:hypothetical protein HDU93_004988 [Gonapodya sp. JEL0774]
MTVNLARPGFHRLVAISIDDLCVDVVPPPSPIAPILQKISGKPPPKPLRLLRNVSATVTPGQVTAIMGASGAGKTTLLNTLAGRIKHASTEGTICFNNRPVSKAILRNTSAYVKQEDTLLPFLTVRETLSINAYLRMPAGIPSDMRTNVVEAIIMELGLKDCANTLIGDSAKRGCSSSEKRRVSVAVQMLSLPQVIFLDEPTSGLDSFSALALIEMLESLAKRQSKTVVLSVHQPRATAFERFDNIILLCRGGHLVYSGPQKDILSYFAKLGYPCPKGVNPADFILDLSSLDTSSEDSEKLSAARLTILIQAWKQHATTNGLSPQKTAEGSGNGEIRGIELSEIRSEDQPAPTVLARSSPSGKPLLIRRSSTNNSLVAPRVSTRAKFSKFFLEFGML